MTPILWAGIIALSTVAAFSIVNGVGAMRTGQVQFRRPTVVLALIIIAIAWGLFAATQLGFIPDHAP
jgi:amino acid transporter